MKRIVLITGGSGFIGTNLVDFFVSKKVSVVNVDIRRPQKEGHIKYWRKADIQDLEAIKEIFRDTLPSEMVHLAARTDSDGTSLEDYVENTDGTQNVLKAAKATPNLARLIVTSTQFVCGPGYRPQHDEDYSPRTVYGESKVITERLTRAADLQCTWTIVRPTNIWGPWHPRYPDEFWRVLKKGLYVHPGKQPVTRSYGYVGNVVHQLEKILESPPPLVNQKVFYLGDKPIHLIDWVNGFARALIGKEVRVVPRGVVRSIALLGVIISSWGIRFPLNSSRFESMTEDYVTPMDRTFEVFGKPPIIMDDGIQETVRWLREQSAFWQ